MAWVELQEQLSSAWCKLSCISASLRHVASGSMFLKVSSWTYVTSI